MPRPLVQNVQTVACVGAGTIGAAWAAYFLSRGLTVVATDPEPAAKAHLMDTVESVWSRLQQLSPCQQADQANLSFTDDLEAAVEGAEFIQESAPDDESLKIKLLRRIGEASPADSVIASSSSTFLPSRLSSQCAHPERVIVGHPFVPAYLIPLVEVVGGEETDIAALDWAMRFYTHVGKRPLQLKKEIEGYIANRLQRAVFAEALELVANGICDYDDIDKAVTWGPGLRWAIQGPVLHRHLGGGKGGVRHMIEHFGWDGEPGGEVRFIKSIESRWGRNTIEELEAWRDDNLTSMLQNLKTSPE